MKKHCLKKNIYIVLFLLSITILLSNCAINYTLSWNNFNMKNPGRMPFEFFQTFKSESERMVYISSILSEHHWFSNLYIITNPTDIKNANEAFTKIENLNSVPLKTIENTLKAFSAVKIFSTNDAPISLNIPMGNGLAAFHLPKSNNDIFYVYINYKRGETSPYITKVRCNILSLQNNEDDIFITFSELKNELIINEHIGLSNIRQLYNNNFILLTKGNYQRSMYGSQLTKKTPQIGFIELKFSDIFSNYQIVDINPPPQNIPRPKVSESYNIPVKATLIGEYAKYNVITERNIAGKSAPWELSKNQILDWIDLNKNSSDFVNALAICTIIADIYDYTNKRFVCVDYCAMFLHIDAEGNNRRLENKITLYVDECHIWMQINIPNNYRDANGNIWQASYIWVDPTWFDAGNIYNFNFFTWGGNYQHFMMQAASNGHRCHGFGRPINWIKQGNVVPGFTYSIVNHNGINISVQDNFGRR